MDKQIENNLGIFGIPDSVNKLKFPPKGRVGEERKFGEDKIEKTREEFVRAQESSSQKLKGLSRILSIKSIMKEVPDVSAMHNYYWAAFRKFLNSELNKLESESLTAGELKIRKGELINFRTFEEKINLLETRTQVQEDKSGYKDEIKKLFPGFLKWHGQNEKGSITRISRSDSDFKQVNDIYEKVSKPASPENEKRENKLDLIMLNLTKQLALGKKENWELASKIKFDEVKLPHLAEALANAKERCQEILGEKADPISGETVKAWMKRILDETVI